MRFFAGCIAFIATFLIVAALAGLGFYLWINRHEPKNTDAHEHSYIAGAIACWLLVLLFAGCICCHRKYFYEALDIIEACAQFVSSNLHGVIVPILSFAVSLLVIVLYAFVAIKLTQIGAKTDFGVEMSKPAKFMWWYNMFGTLWILFYIVYLCEYIIICGACHWYFSFKTEEQGKADFYRGFCWGIWKNAGSVAFAALISAIVAFIRIIVKTLEEQAKDSGNPAQKCIFCIVNTCLACVQKIVDYINKNGLIQVALTGENFCESAYHGFMLMLTNPAQFAITEFVGNFFMLLGTIAITLASTLGGYFVFQQYAKGDNGQALANVSVDGATVALFVVSLVIAKLFMTMYHVSLTTILQCFLVSVTLAKNANSDIENHVPPVLHQWIKKIHEQDAEKQKLMSGDGANDLA